MYRNMRKKNSEKTTRRVLAGLAPYEPEREALQFDTKNGRLLFRKRKLLQIFKVHSQRERTLAQSIRATPSPSPGNSRERS